MRDEAAYKNNLGRARFAGALTGMVGGNKLTGNKVVRAQLQMFEDIIGWGQLLIITTFSFSSSSSSLT